MLIIRIVFYVNILHMTYKCMPLKVNEYIHNTKITLQFYKNYYN